MNTTTGTEIHIPEGVDFLGEEDLYLVPFELITVAEKSNEQEQNEYHWSNPRYLGSNETSEGHGFGTDDMQALYKDLKEEGLIFPLLCRWINKDNVVCVQVIDGERRYRCLERMRNREDTCYSRKLKADKSFSEVYGRVPCKIVTTVDDKEALKIAVMVSDRHASWGDGATAKLIFQLRKCNCTDEEILSLTKKSGQWLREMDRICDLDELTFSYLVDGKINRTVALKLSDVYNMTERHDYLNRCYIDAVQQHQEVVNKAENDLVKAEEKEEFAEAQLVEAQLSGDKVAIDQANENLEEATKKTDEKRKKRKNISRPQGKSRNLKRVVQQVVEESEEEDEPTEDDNGADGLITPLRPGKIRKHLETIEKIIDGKDQENKDIFPVETLRVIASCYKAILNGEDNIVSVLKRAKTYSILINKRNQKKNDVTEVLEEMETASV